MTALPPPAAAVAAARADTKQWLRSANDAEDGVLDALVESALVFCEEWTGTLLVARDCQDRFDPQHGWRRLSARPVRAITGVMVRDAADNALPLSVGDYAMDIDADGIGWVRVSPDAGGAAHVAHVEYQAGLASQWASVPEPLAQGVVLFAAHLFNARDADAAPPAAVRALWRPWRPVRLLPERCRA